jgi:hypothetical protein
MPSNAHRQFTQLMGYVDQLIGIHGKLQQGQGRRHEQDAIHRAGVVMVVAAWEGYVEQVLLESFGAMERDAGVVVGVPGAAAVPTWARHTFGIRRTELINSLKQFNTPNAQNVQRLMREWMQFDPFPAWSWHVRARQWDTGEMQKRANQWLNIRHGIAHGSGLPQDIPWIQGANNRPRLTLLLLRECKRFFERLVQQTDDAFLAFLQAHHGLAAPW